MPCVSPQRAPYCHRRRQLLLAHMDEDWRERYLKQHHLQGLYARYRNRPGSARAILEWVRSTLFGLHRRVQPRSGAIAARY